MLIPRSLYPTVPLLPGVPNVPRLDYLNVVKIAALSQLDAAIFKAISVKRNWGIYDKKGNKVLEPDTLLTFDYINESLVAMFPTQNGSFASYNKVHTPYQVTVVLRKSGNLRDRQQFSAALESICEDTELYTVITPERSYFNANLSRRGLRRTADNGASNVDYEVMLQEVRQVNAEYAKKKKSSTDNARKETAKPAKTNGKVDGNAPTPTTKTSALASIFG